MAPELALVWCVLLVMWLSGTRTARGGWFLVSGPLFLQNLTVPLSQYSFPIDFVFAPLWFVGALLQLQLLLFVFRRVMVTVRPTLAVAVVVLIGAAFRWLMALALGARGGELDPRMADVLYNLPLTHIEPIALGFLIGSGSLTGVGRRLWPLTLMTVSASIVGAAGSVQHIPIGSLGLQYPLRGGYMYVWTYTLLAFVAAALCSPENAIARYVRSLTLPPWVDRAVCRLSALSFGAYVFHGAIIASGLTLEPWLRAKAFHPATPIVTVMAVLESLLAAQLMMSARHFTGRVVASHAHASVASHSLREPAET